MNTVRHKWANTIYDQMVGNFWIPQTVDMTDDKRTKDLLTEHEKTALYDTLGFLIFMDSFQVANLPNISEVITSPIVKFCLSIQQFQECFDKETELLTSDGWVKCPEITDQHTIAQYDKETKEISFVKPKKVVNYDYKGKMHHYVSNSTDICVTPNHDLILIHPSSKKVQKRKSFEGSWGNNYLYPCSGIATGNWDLSLLDRLLIAIQADGSLYGLCPNETVERKDCVFKLKKQRKINRLIELLNGCNISYNLRIDGEGFNIFNFKLPENIDISLIKNFKYFSDLSVFSFQSANDFIDEVLFWDGSDNRLYYNTNKEAIDLVQSVCTIANRRATIGINRNQEQSSRVKLPQGGFPKSSKICYVLSISFKSERMYPRRIEVDYDDKVYCVSVDTENLVSRRNGKIAFTGNTIHTQSYQYIAETLLPTSERDAIYNRWKDVEALRERIQFIASIANEYLANPSLSNFYKVLVANYILEGLYFYQGFNYFDQLSHRNKLVQCSKQIDFIRTDEHTHLGIFVNILKEIGIDDLLIISMVKDAVRNEIKWCHYVYGDRIMGISKKSSEVFVKWLANERLGRLGIPPIYKDVDNPYKHLELSEKKGSVRENFFEQTVTSYDNAGSLEGWDLI